MNIRLPFTAAFQIGFAAIVVCLAAPGGFAQSAATGIVGVGSSAVAAENTRERPAHGGGHVARSVHRCRGDLPADERTRRVSAGDNLLHRHTRANEVVTVSAGQILQHDIMLAAASAKGDGSIVKLDEFRVSTSREMDAAAIAINEQRFASRIKNVVSTDEFGNVAEGNAAEFLKFLPGSASTTPAAMPANLDQRRAVGLRAGDGRRFQRRAGHRRTCNTNRAVQSDMISINNLSRIEVAYSPTPESQGSALAARSTWCREAPSSARGRCSTRASII